MHMEDLSRGAILAVLVGVKTFLNDDSTSSVHRYRTIRHVKRVAQNPVNCHGSGLLSFVALFFWQITSTLNLRFCKV